MSGCFSLSLSHGVRRHYRVVHKIKFFKPTLRLFTEFAAYLVVARKGTFVVPALILPLPAATFFSESFPLTKHCCDPLGQGIALLLCHDGIGSFLVSRSICLVLPFTMCWHDIGGGHTTYPEP